ncbi:MULTISPECIES: DUF2955 domain-containing protein [Microbulbifer]|uniref:DUF2955 domain-containing protein n=1 Tax=Microbulbifer celer TaxID=435905 RepID=A0ABW3U712_9GAMM|nr:MULTISPECIES: DUF2955 domain-containing protein [Microbulbifer]UFN58785.1 DUF2955 domain-containing protein [Microbulbifer celer]
MRIACAGTAGFIVSQVLDTGFGVFYIVFPVFLLGILPTINGHIIRQFIAAAVLSCVEVALLQRFLGHSPVMMTLAVFALFYGRFLLMAKGPLFLLGANGTLVLSIMLHFSSYPDTDIGDMFVSSVSASVFALAIALLMWVLFPNTESRPPAVRPKRSSAVIRHHSLLGGLIATLSFAVFQTFNLRDSLSAQVSTIIILLALNYPAALLSARKRALGTLLGCSLALFMQLLLYSHGDNLLLVLPCLWIGMMIFARAHVLEGGASGIGFGGLMTLAILFGQYVAPDQDLIFSALYRFSSVCAALIFVLGALLAVGWFLNRFELTREYPTADNAGAAT